MRAVLALAFTTAVLFRPTLAAADAAPAELRAAFLKLLDRPKVPLDPKVLDTRETEEGTTVEHLLISSEKKRTGLVERVPMLVVRPAGSPTLRRPTVLVLHGTGGSKESQREWLDKLAAKGFLAVAIDARYHGERVGVKNGAQAYVSAITAAWRAKPAEQEHPFFYDTVWDIWRTLDYLETRPDVDRSRIGMVGFSMGGIQTWLAASVDRRVRVSVPAIAAQSFRFSLERDQWQGRAKTIWGAHEAAAKDLGDKEVNQKVCRALWSKLLPGILDRFDLPSMAPLFTPRPLLITSGELDPNNPFGGAQLAHEATRTAYKKAGAADNLKILVAMGVGHKVTDEHKVEIMTSLVKWLGPEQTTQPRKAAEKPGGRAALGAAQ